MFQDLTIFILTILIVVLIALNEKFKVTIMKGEEFKLMGSTYRCMGK